MGKKNRGTQQERRWKKGWRHVIHQTRPQEPKNVIEGAFRIPWLSLVTTRTQHGRIHMCRWINRQLRGVAPSETGGQAKLFCNFRSNSSEPSILRRNILSNESHWKQRIMRSLNWILNFNRGKKRDPWISLLTSSQPEPSASTACWQNVFVGIHDELRQILHDFGETEQERAESYRIHVEFLRAKTSHD